MKIVIFNMRKYKWVSTVIKSISVVLVIMCVVSVGVGAYMKSERYVQALQTENEKCVIIIDAGHGGEDPGAVGVNGQYEKDLNLIIANAVGEALSKEGFAVVYTRTEDKLLYTEDENIYGIRKISDLKNRCKIVAEYPNAIFVSIHMNSFGDPKYSGSQVYYSAKNEGSELLAGCIQGKIKDSVQNENERKTKVGKGMYVLENVENVAVLVECGFLTNELECQKLSEKEYQKQLSLAIVCGIIEYKERISSY